MIMDLKDLDVVAAANRGADVELVHPITREPLDATITILGRDSDEYRAAISEQARKRAQSRNKGAISFAEADDGAMEILVACTIGWDGIVENGDPIQFSLAEARRIYKKYPWIREQVDEALADRALFLPSK